MGAAASITSIVKKTRDGRVVFEVDAKLDGGKKTELNLYEDGTIRSRR